VFMQDFDALALRDGKCLFHQRKEQLFEPLVHVYWEFWALLGAVCRECLHTVNSTSRILLKKNFKSETRL